MVEPVRRVLVPMDGSPLSREALAVALTDYPDASVTVVYVADPTEPAAGGNLEVDPDVAPPTGSEEWREGERERAEAIFEAARGIAGEHDAEIETETTVDRAASAIVDAAERHDADVIVMGSHGREESARFLLGIVSEVVAFRAPCRVLLVR
jgi:nucleotide-binding universal stress UspA family protein